MERTGRAEEAAGGGEAGEAGGPVRVRLGEDGGLSLAPALRAALGAGPGDEVVIRIEAGGLRIENPRADRARARGVLAGVEPPPGGSWTDDFLAQRRAMWGE